MSNSNHDPKNKECAIYGEEHEKEIECEHPCTCRPEQKEEWEFQARNILLNEQIDGDFIDMFIGYMKGTVDTAEERGRRATITAFVEWAGKQEWLNKGDLLKFADSLKSNLTQKS